jgi:ketosteroid isomerase-like protein
MRKVALLVLVALSLSCGRGLSRQRGIVAPETGEAAAIRAARMSQNAAIRASDIDRVAFFWTEEIVVLAGLGARVHGVDALKRAFAADGRILYERLPSDIQLSAGWSLAWETGTWTGKDRSANDATLVTGRYSAQWVKTESGWKIHSELFVADRCFATACSWPLAIR